MKIAILADIHANAAALQAVRERVVEAGVQGVWFLGDAVGRGPDPLEVISWLRECIHSHPESEWVLGNHDCMLANLLNKEQWSRVNPSPRLIIERHRAIVAGDPLALDFVQQAFNAGRIEPRLRTQSGVNYFLVHGGQVDKAGYYRYVYGWYTENFMPAEFERLEALSEDVGGPCVQLYGHTHVPALIAGLRTSGGWQIDVIKVRPGKTYFLDPGYFWIVNPGSVGQPRDKDRRAAYALLDTTEHTIRFERVEYNWRETARKMILEHYPVRLVEILKQATPDEHTPDEWLEHYDRVKAMG